MAAVLPPKTVRAWEVSASTTNAVLARVAGEEALGWSWVVAPASHRAVASSTWVADDQAAAKGYRGREALPVFAKQTSVPDTAAVRRRGEVENQSRKRWDNLVVTDMLDLAARAEGSDATPEASLFRWAGGSEGTHAYKTPSHHQENRLASQ